MKINWSFIEPVRDQAARLRGDFIAKSEIVKLAEQQAEIDALKAEVARLREALRPFKEGYDSMALVSKNLNKPLQEIIKLEKGMVPVKMKSIFEDDKMSSDDKIFFMECEMAAYFSLQCAILLQFKGDKI